MDYVGLFFAGAFLCNCIPHLAAGLRGEAFPTPFAKPRGVGLSSPLLNFIWGYTNALVGGLLLARHGLPAGTADIVIVALGVFVMGSYLALHFSSVRQGRLRQQDVDQAP